MINLAIKDLLIKFLLINILEDELFLADYYICSGAMNILEKKIFIFIKNVLKLQKMHLYLIF